MSDPRLDVRIWLDDDDVQEFPWTVVPDWEEQARAATAACRLIDRHLDYEAHARDLWVLEELPPRVLCPEQRVQLITDLLAVTRS
jgi:hypothetical protein